MIICLLEELFLRTGLADELFEGAGDEAEATLPSRAAFLGGFEKTSFCCFVVFVGTLVTDGMDMNERFVEEKVSVTDGTVENASENFRGREALPRLTAVSRGVASTSVARLT